MDLYKIDLMDKSKPDYHIESYWYGLKTSMINFYKNLKIKRPLEKWSKKLNELQKTCSYKEIENTIRNYIGLYAIDLMRFDKIGGDCKILNTNIKRWNKISYFQLDIEKKDDKYHNIIFLLFDIYHSLIVKNSINREALLSIFESIELILVYQDYTDLIKFAVNNQIHSILDKLQKSIDINNWIKKIYKIDIIPIMKSRKLVRYLLTV